MKKLLLDEPLFTERGERLEQVEIAYHSYGRLSPARDNAVWICHALTANSDAAAWWKGLIGPGMAIDTRRFFVVCANIIGSCYGSTGPLSTRPDTGQPWCHNFPRLSVRDMVQAHERLREQLGLERLRALIGGSLGGQQALEWAVEHPERIGRLVLLATNARHSAWGVAFNEAQRMAIAADPSWSQARPDAGLQGMRAARAVALLSYRHYQAYADTQSEASGRYLGPHRAASYQQYQGDKLAARFNAFSYWRLSEAMDSHDIARGRGTEAEALARVQARSLVLGIRSDGLFPPAEQEALARGIPGADLHLFDSRFGHDGFLVETETIARILKPFLSTSSPRSGAVPQTGQLLPYPR